MGPHRRSSNDSNGENNNPTNNIPAEDFDVDFDILNGPWPCGMPKGHSCLYANGGNSEHIAITNDDLVGSEAIKILCSNEQCPRSPFLHTACFAAFEETILNHLKSQGRARGWSDKQRAQNLWTKRGYDLVYKVCECSCGHGYVRKDLDWNPPMDEKTEPGDGEGEAHNANEEVNGTKRKRKKSKSQSKPQTITIGLPTLGGHSNAQQRNQERQPEPNNIQVTSSDQSPSPNSSTVQQAQNFKIPPSLSSSNTSKSAVPGAATNPIFYQVSAWDNASIWIMLFEYLMAIF